MIRSATRVLNFSTYNFYVLLQLEYITLFLLLNSAIRFCRITMYAVFPNQQCTNFKLLGLLISFAPNLFSDCDLSEYPMRTG